jgi:16S rRNA (guanine527-N7)-methyltransferase
MALNGFSDLVKSDESRKFYELTERMLTVNEYMNLTAIKDPAAIILLHYADSLTAARFLPENAKIADIGCGAGFPCLPLAICRPDLSILALDSTEKRIQYVKQTAELLKCENLSAVAMRAEEAGKGGYREQFDVCTARAVASLPALSELCLPFVRIGGTFLAMKGKKGEEELKEATSAIKKLGGEVAELHAITLRSQVEEDTRYLIEIKKVKPTPAEFPRQWARILKKPL